MIGNKGGASIRFRFYDSTMCFVCSHLAAHRGNVSGRNADFHNIVDKTVFKDVVAQVGGTGAPLSAGAQHQQAGYYGCVEVHAKQYEDTVENSRRHCLAI